MHGIYDRTHVAFEFRKRVIELNLLERIVEDLNDLLT